MTDDTNNTGGKLAGCLVTSLIFFLMLCRFLKNVNLISGKMKDILRRFLENVNLIAGKMKSMLKNRYIWLVLGEVKKFLDRFYGVPLFIKYYPKWRNNEADFLDKIACLFGAGALVGFISYCCQLCVRILELFGYQIFIID